MTKKENTKHCFFFAILCYVHLSTNIKLLCIMIICQELMMKKKIRTMKRISSTSLALSSHRYRRRALDWEKFYDDDNDDDDAGLSFENLYHYYRISPNRVLSLDTCDSKVQEMSMNSLHCPNLFLYHHVMIPHPEMQSLTHSR